MIVRRFGSTVESVEPHFDARALTEIGFRRTGGFSMAAEEFFERYGRGAERELAAETEGGVKDEVEQALLVSLRGQLDEAQAGLGDGEVLLVENESGKDYPKTRDRTRTTVVEGENRRHFTYTVDPPLRVAVYGKKD